MFYSCRCHFTARVHRRAAVLWTGNLPEKCFSVMQMFWLTSTGGHKPIRRSPQWAAWGLNRDVISTFNRFLWFLKWMSGCFIIWPYYKARWAGEVLVRNHPWSLAPALTMNMLRLSDLSTDAQILASSLPPSHISLFNSETFPGLLHPNS